MSCSWKKVSLGILAFFTILLGIIVFLIGTTTGLHLLFSAANRFVPGLEIGQVTGDWDDLRLKNIHYQRFGVMINAGELHLSAKLNCLRDKELCINDLSLKNVSIVVDSKRMLSSSSVKSTLIEKENNDPLLSFSIPYPILFCQIVLNNINIKIDNTIFSIMNFTTGFRWKEKNLTFFPTSLQGVLISSLKTVDITQKEIVPPKVQKLYVKKNYLARY